MSHYSEWKTDMKDRALVLAALLAAAVKYTVAAPGALRRGETARIHIAPDRDRGLWGYGGIDLVADKDGAWKWAGDSDVLRNKTANSPKGVIGGVEMWYKALAAKQVVEAAGQHLTLSLDAATGLVLGEYTMEVSA